MSPDNIKYICTSCYNNLHGKKNKLPAQAVANGLQLKEMPEKLQDLNDLECYFISLCIPFMKLIALQKGKQFCINGPCVNVPAKTNVVVDLLLQMPEEVQVVDIKLKCKLAYKGHHMSMKDSARKSFAALKWLKQHNTLSAKININHEWEQKCASNELWQFLTGNSATQIAQTIHHQSQNR